MRQLVGRMRTLSSNVQFVTIGSDDSSNSPLKAWVRALEMIAAIARNASVTFPVLIETLADRFGATPALLSDRECLTYRALAERANQYARWALGQGLAAGDVVCLLMPNCPEYMAIWLGITHVRGIVALLNTNLTGDSLAHSINLVAPKHVIVGADLVDSFAAVSSRLAPGVKSWTHGQCNHDFPRIDHEIQRLTGDELQNSERLLPSIMDPALYIYTSGTTGLPKAAKVSHFRVMQWSHWFAGMMDTRPSDRMYNCLPMYHSIGGVVATGAILVNGGSVLLRERFSASHFWDDVVEWNCTLFQYIGELCRYLVNSPPHPREAEHQIRLCCGNGLRPDVWDEFKRRFRIPQILEFYAATESNFSLYNCEGKLGAIGRIPSFLAHRISVALVKFDIETGEPIRNEEGFCVRCSANEVGEAIGKILDDGSSLGSRFEGYTDKEASARKVLRDVFVNGDAWFRTGDLMRRDERGYFFFVDRVGDTFRWKGENVSTTEVADTISAFAGVIEVVVYGVAIPGTDGRAGMAAVVVSEDFGLAAFRQHLAERLPEYARPLFLRIRGAIEMTATFKPKKQDLSREGYDPNITADPIYFDDRVRQAFVKLDAALYERLQTGKVRL
jgi:fatty-acyl-CoA synthase